MKYRVQSCVSSKHLEYVLDNIPENYEIERIDPYWQKSDSGTYLFYCVIIKEKESKQ